VVAWLYRAVGGIDTAQDGPGFRRMVIHPHPDEQLTQARSECESVYGKIASEWSGTPTGPFILRVTIPANTRAQVLLPAIPKARVTEGSHTIAAKLAGDSYVVEIGSGTYEFKVTP
jgi:alpha-L-rhamnosidase